MALSMDEQRMLAEIERRLAAQDPGLATRLSSFRRPGPAARLRTTRGKIIGTIWARRMPGASAPNTRLTAAPPVESNFARGSTGEDLA